MANKRAAAGGTRETRTLRDRAEISKASAKRVFRKDLADQPSQETLPPESAGVRVGQAFSVASQPKHGGVQALDGKKDRGGAGDRRQPKGNADMGRHESFGNATPIVMELASATALSGTGGFGSSSQGSSFGKPPPLGAAASLAEACAWAVSQVAWINSGVATEENWGDELLDAESSKAEQVVIRAVAEPSPDLRTLAGKARIVLQELENEGSHDGDNRDLLITTVLRELIERGDRETDGLHASSYAESLSLRDESMSVLRALSDVASTLAEVACAITCQPRCEAANGLNAAGEFADWIRETSNWVMDSVRGEARPRLPSTHRDRETRLQILATSTIDNGDPEEIFTLAREMAAEAACHG